MASKNISINKQQVNLTVEWNVIYPKVELNVWDIHLVHQKNPQKSENLWRYARQWMVGRQNYSIWFNTPVLYKVSHKDKQKQRHTCLYSSQLITCHSKDGQEEQVAFWDKGNPSTWDKHERNSWVRGLSCWATGDQRWTRTPMAKDMRGTLGIIKICRWHVQHDW